MPGSYRKFHSFETRNNYMSKGIWKIQKIKTRKINVKKQNCFNPVLELPVFIFVCSLLGSDFFKGFVNSLFRSQRYLWGFISALFFCHRKNSTKTMSKAKSLIKDLIMKKLSKLVSEYNANQKSTKIFSEFFSNKHHGVPLR